MQYKITSKWLLIVFLCIFSNACVVTSYGSRDKLTEEEKADLYLQMGVRYMELNMLKTSKQRLEKALDIDSDNADVHNALGALHERLGQFEIAGDYYEYALKKSRDNASIKNNYGQFLCERKGDYTGGMVLLNEALALPLNNKKWIALTNKGRCQLKSAKKKLAEPNFRRALRLNRNYLPALLEMQKISYQTRKYMSAQAFLQRYIALAEHNPETLWYAVQTERALGNKELTEQYREMLFSLFPESKEAKQLRTAIR
ncbi:MAG: type IV pilus biogenesis/stability protein PilW [Methylococcales bacterium]|nr:type IV pilus biogenesis/stability protein PilW [Methylococcales bacterium]